MPKVFRGSEEKSIWLDPPPEMYKLVKEGGRLHSKLSTQLRCWKVIREEGRLLIGARVEVFKSVIEFGRWSIGPWNRLPNLTSCKYGGGFLKEELNLVPKVRWVVDLGSESAGMLNEEPNLRWVILLGK